MSDLRERIDRTVRRLDQAQQRRAWSAFPLAVVRKFMDDRAGRLAALIAYYGFFSLFPLLLALVTIVGFLIRGDPELQQRIIGSALSEFPIVGEKIRQSVHALRGSVPVLAFGLLGALWSGLAVVTSIQSAMDEIWAVPRSRRPGFLARLARGLLILASIGTVVVVSGVLAGLGSTGGSLPVLGRLVAFGASVAMDTAFLAILFRWLPTRDLSWSDVLPGAAAGGLAWSVLLTLGAYLVDHRIRQATQVYGFFAVVIGLLSWLFIGAQILLVAAEINVVRVERRWPRSLARASGGALE